MKLSERLGVGLEQYYFPRQAGQEYDEDLNRWTIAVPFSIEAWVRQTVDRGRSIAGVFSSFRAREENWFDHILEGIEFVGRMEIADLASNGLRAAVLWDNRDNSRQSTFGKMLTRAFNNPGLSDHNHEHSRRHERWLESMFLNIGELRHSHSVFTWLDSAMLFSYWHDVDQLLSLERNFTEGTNFPVKRGHALAAAAMVFALSDRYAVERKVSKHRAWEICGGAALMIARHDLPERFAAGLAGMAKAYNQNPDGTRELLRGEELKKLFDKNELDLFTMAPSQLMELLTMEKAGSGFVDPARDQTWGLLPSFEDEYMTKLVALAHNDRPIFGDISPEDRMVYRYGAEAVVLADVFDMVAPPIESIMRKLNTQHAQRRPFYRSEMDVLSQLSQIRDSVGNIDHQFDSDVRRVLWELVHMEHIKDGVIAESPYVNSINRDVAIMAALSFKDIGQRIMAGDLTDIERHYQFRKSQVARKTLAKANYSKINYRRIF